MKHYVLFCFILMLSKKLFFFTSIKSTRWKSFDVDLEWLRTCALALTFQLELTRVKVVVCDVLYMYLEFHFQ